MFDNFEVAISINSTGLLVDADVGSDTVSTVNPNDYQVEMQNVELHMSYYDVSEDEVRNIRE